MSKCDSLQMRPYYSWTIFGQNFRTMLSIQARWFQDILDSPFPYVFFSKMHASGPKKKTWYNSEELKLETNTVLNSPTGIQFPKSNEETSVLLREALENKNVITLITLPCKTKAIVSKQKFYFWGQRLDFWFLRKLKDKLDFTEKYW